MSEPPPARPRVVASSRFPESRRVGSIALGLAFALGATVLLTVGDVGLAALCALLSGGILLRTLSKGHRPHLARIGAACVALGTVASFVHVVLRVIGP